MTTKPPLPPGFVQKKEKILSQLAVPVSEYHDLSPKDSIDKGIRDLIDEINLHDGFVTTSSCAGRISVFGEGQKKRQDNDLLLESDTREASEEELGAERSSIMKPAGVGGKGGGGKWLYVSHDPVDISSVESSLYEFLGLSEDMDHADTAQLLFSNNERLIHFKFEPLILHILTASLGQAQIVLSAALQAGFRESGAITLTSTESESATPMVAVRSTGLSLDSMIGCHINGKWQCFVSQYHLRALLVVANQRFEENTRRITRFRELLTAGILASNDSTQKTKADGSIWEDASTRRERKKIEGLKRSQELRQGMERDV